MFDNSVYHKLHSIVPPTAEEDVLIRDSLLRLENITACTIVKNGNDNILSNIPPHLHQILWKSYLFKKYYATEDDEDDGSYDNTFDELPLLLYNWPHREFKLKDLMPRFPSRLDEFTCRFQNIFRFDPYSENLEYFDEFCMNLIFYIIDSFKKAPCNSSSEQKKNYCKLRIIDVTGYCFSPNVDIIERIKTKDLILKNKYGNLNIILDPTMYIYGKHIPCSYTKSLNCTLIKLNHISVNSSFRAPKLVKRLIKKLVKNGPISINLNGNDDGSESNALEDIYDCDTWRSNVLSVKAMCCVSSMNFLLHLDNLVHLNLKCNDMHGKLGSLATMSRGLLYLNMCYCKLTNSDLQDLSKSCHMLTLRELKLRANDFSYDGDSNNLIELCENLSNLLKLDICDCKLESWPNAGMSLLFISMKNMPNILDLNIYLNAFCIDNVYEHIMKLKQSSSLRYLLLSRPLQVNDAYLFRNDLYEKMNISRLQLLYVCVV